ncbi:hypothetical protein L1987_71024 [Smallanthus sonchifolius]|uniref:Uncharacterized protein n=1 Tax=Smallanthus sonchifolius TaxID=185202 RepID=A0ACB9ARH8_9ASTR|nr:hypothetical protein L1987_71024 [Smallanthus sonchifolius]
MVLSDIMVVLAVMAAAVRGGGSNDSEVVLYVADVAVQGGAHSEALMFDVQSVLSPICSCGVEDVDHAFLNCLVSKCGVDYLVDRKRFGDKPINSSDPIGGCCSIGPKGG